jgi:hypothetical protein
MLWVDGLIVACGFAAVASALERDRFVCGVTNNPRCVLAADDVIDERLANVAFETRVDSAR